ncbi:outer membrane beta-barrel protein [Pedobacter sp. UYP24]
MALAKSTFTAGQTTKTTLAGRVSSIHQPKIEGVLLTLIHLPTGTVYGCSTNSSGSFFLPDLKPGGPYQIEANYQSFKKYQETGLFFRLGEPSILNIVLKSEVNELPEIKITAISSGKLLKKNTSGPIFYTGSRELEIVPSIRRSLVDYIKLSSLAFGPAIAGGNYRQNFITVDGSEFNNNFGVGDNLPGNGAQPIALDAIAEMSIEAAPYHSIWESGFIGSAINIITRSGSNAMEGSLYGYFRNQDSYGYKAADQQVDKRQVMYHLEGFRLGGPVIKNKLFYFFSLEMETEKLQPQPFNAATLEQPFGSNSNIARPTSAELDEISNYLRNTYHYDTGPYQDYDFKNKSTKALLRLDWNLSDNHKISLRYNQLHAKRPELVNGSRSPLVPFAASTGRRALNSLPFSNSNFTTLSDFYSIAGEWNSRLSPTLTNTLRTSYTRQYEPRESESEYFPFVDILKDGIPFTSFGYEPFSYGNVRDVSLVSLNNRAQWTHGKGIWTGGFQLDYCNTKNSYMPFGTGYYTFRSWEDFALGNKPLDYALTYPQNNRSVIPEYSFNYLSTAAFMQYSVMLNDQLSLTAGIRIDFPLFPRPLPENKVLASLEFAGGQHLNTGQLPKPALLTAPRAVMTYDLNSDKNIRLRLGSGIFTGRIPFVWIISQARYSGVYQLTQTWQGIQNTPFTFHADEQSQYVTDQTAVLPSVTSVLARDFKMPQSWKSTLGIDVVLPGGLKGIVEVLYSRDIRGILFKDINLSEPSILNIPGYADHRLVYPFQNQLKFVNPLNTFGQYDPQGNSPLNAVVVGNSSKGYYFSSTARVEKQVANGINFSFAYSRNSAKNYNDGDGDQTLSALNATPTANGINHPELGYAAYVPTGRIVSTLGFVKQYSKHLKFYGGLVYQGVSEGRFSYTYGRDFIGDRTNRSLIYVPKDASEIQFSPLTTTVSGKTFTYSREQQTEAFFSYLDQDRYLRTRKGKYAERNAGLIPWRNQFDIRLMQELTIVGHGKRHGVQFSIDIINAGNMLNRNWGLRKQVVSSAILIPSNLEQVVPDGNIVPTFQFASSGGKLLTQTFKTDITTNSTYQMQFGLRYLFK